MNSNPGLLPARGGLFVAITLLAGQGPLAAEPPVSGSDVAGQTTQFEVAEYRVLGNTVLSPIEVEKVLYPLLGTGKTIGDVDKARATLENRYHELGYGTVFVDIPEQDVTNGVVRLKVTEAKLEKARVTGARYFSAKEIREALPEAKPNVVLHIPDLQAQLAALNAQTPDRGVTPVLKAGTRPGTVDLALTVQDKLPLHGSLELNNQNSIDTTDLRAVASLSYDDLFGRLDSLSLQYQTSPEDTDEVKVWAASYTARLSSSGHKLAFFYVNSDSDVATVGDGGGSLTVLGKGQIYGTRFIAPLFTSADTSEAFTAGIEYKDFTESVFTAQTVLTPISYLNLSMGFAGGWRLGLQQLSLQSSVNFGVRSHYNTPEEFAVKRFRAEPNYFLMRTDVGYTRVLPAKMSLRLRGAGQWANESIISNEQFSIAGASGVRGYLEAELLGDAGIKGSIELGSPRWSLFADRFQGEVFGFFDYGRMTRINPLRAQDPRTLELLELLERPNQTLRSAGAGLDMLLFDHVHALLFWAYPLVDSDVDRGTLEGDSRWQFTLNASW